MKGFLLIDKEKGLTSFDVVKKVRNFSKEKKVGHAGTLDPLATGLLIVGIGEGTKLLEYFVGLDKEYEVSAFFGASSDTYDAEGKISEVDLKACFAKKDVERVICEKFLGEILQIPPKYSALKILGKKACEIVRKGGEVEMKERKVKIYDFIIVNFNWPNVSFLVKCGSGTYIRSLINDLGEELKCGAYVAELRRTKIGRFSVEESHNLDILNNNIEQYLVALEDMVADFDRFDLRDEEYDVLIKKGILNKKIDHDVPIMAFYRDELVGVLEKRGEGQLKWAKRIM